MGRLALAALAALFAIAAVGCAGDGARPAATGAAPVVDDARLFALLDAVPAYDATPDPLPLIAAVNALQSLGTERAVAVLGAYLRARPPGDSGGRRGSFLVMRTLFDVDGGAGHPPMRVGAPDVDAAAGADLPRFPIAIVEDVPLRLVGGYSLAGKAEQPEAHLAYYAKAGKVRARLLIPPADPLAVFDRLAGRSGTDFLRAGGLDSDAARARILEQGLRLVAGNGAPPPTVAGLTGAELDRRWQELRAAAPPVVWDAATSRYRPAAPAR